MKILESIRYNMNNLYGFIGKLGEAPDSELDSKFAKMCKVFVKEDHNEEESIGFLRNLCDCCVRYSAGSSFVVSTIHIMANMQQEDEIAQAKRRKMLERWESGEIEKWEL